VREAPTCTCDERLGDVTDRMRRSSDDFCLVILAEQKVVLGLLRGDALIKDPDARVEDVMELGPKTTRPSELLQELIESNDAVGVKHFFVATSHGALLGVLDRDTADRAVATWRKGEERA
jgi:Mg/Co/Ni transporter MgtE